MSEAVPIAFCITDLDRGGAELALVQLVTRLGDDWAPHVFCLTHRGRLADELEQAGIPVTSFGLRLWNLPLVVWRLRRALRNTRPRLLQTFLYHANLMGRFAARLAGVRTVVAGIRVAEKRSRLRLQLDRWTDWLVTRHVCVSEGVAQFSTEQGGLRRDRLVVIPNGVDVSRFQEAEPADLTRFGVPEGAFTVLFVGRLEPQKAPEVLLSAVEQLESLPQLHVLLVGAGDQEVALRERVSAGPLYGRVHFAGRQKGVPALMAAADCLALTSRWEGMPNVVLEAMAAGLPVVSTDVEGILELLGDGRGLVVPVDDAEAVAEGLRTLCTDDRLRESLGSASQSYVAKEFTWDRMAASYADLYAALLSD